MRSRRRRNVDHHDFIIITATSQAEPFAMYSQAASMSSSAIRQPGLFKAGRRHRSPAAPAPHHASKQRAVVRASAAPETSGADTSNASTEGLNKFSSRITQPKSQGASQAMLYATGLTESDMNKPQVLRQLARVMPSGSLRSL